MWVTLLLVVALTCLLFDATLVPASPVASTRDNAMPIVAPTLEAQTRHLNGLIISTPERS